ncbi:MAG: 3-deoxy-D-manno-octulosonic acid transferase [Deferrisomatales bacterium]
MKKGRWSLGLYQGAGWGALALSPPVLALRALTDRRYRVGWGERVGRWGQVPRGGVWVHGASVGEVGAAAPLVRELRDRGTATVVSATSPAGREAAARLVGPGAARLLPADLCPLVRRALEAASPRAVVLLETELWPGLLWEARRAGVPVLLVSARLSERSFRRYARVARALGPFLAALDEVHAQSAEEARRFVALGVPADRVEVVGNLKFDAGSGAEAEPPGAIQGAVAAGWDAVVAGSTHPGEEEAVLAAAARARAAGARPGVILAPRHLERLGRLRRELAARGPEPAVWSELEDEARGLVDAFARGAPVLVDRYGLLAGLYRGARCAFVGGSLVPVGGHNLLEPLRWGVPVVFGPFIENCREVAREILRRRLGRQVKGAGELGEALAAYLLGSTGGAEVARGAREFLAAHRGAAARAVEALERRGAVAPRRDGG